MQRMEQPYQMMQNPCTTDQVRFACGPDAACLKAHVFYSQARLGEDGQMY